MAKLHGKLKWLMRHCVVTVFPVPTGNPNVAIEFCKKKIQRHTVFCLLC